MKYLVEKISSGRFIFTIVTAFVFAYCAIHGTIGTDKVMEVVLLVIYAYFNRQDRNKV